MKLSSVFDNNKWIPERYTCDGQNINPKLIIEGVPEEAKSLVLIVDDPDIPNEVKEKMRIKIFDHWVLFNIPPDIDKIEEDSFVGIQGKNSKEENKYTGPCPPPKFEPKVHRYFFKLYALNKTLDLNSNANKFDVENAMKNHIIDKVELVGVYSRS